jgi:hypothetical protein
MQPVATQHKHCRQNGRFCKTHRLLLKQGGSTATSKIEKPNWSQPCPLDSACEMLATTNQQRKPDAETKTQLPTKLENRRRKHSTLPIIF